jgi:isocitrate lyase
MAKTVASKNNYAPRGVKKKRPGVHSKTKFSKLKASKLYKKLNRGQG